MRIFIGLGRARAPLLAALTLAGATGVLLAASGSPASALCRYGSPHCVNPNPGPMPPKVGGVAIPPSNWVDPDCKYYGNCNSPNSALLRQPGGRPRPGQILVK